MTAAPKTLPACVKRFADERPNAVALREKRYGIWEEIAWDHYYREVAAVGHMLSALGIGPGDHVAILSENRTEWVYADLGAQGIGARSVGIYQTNTSADVAYVLKHSKARILFCEDQEQVDKFMEARADLEHVERVIVFDPRGLRHYEEPRLSHFQEFMQAGRGLREQDPDWFANELEARDPKEPAMVVYTSGTTGDPKGALISSHNVLSIAGDMARELGVGDADTLLSYLPLCHVAEKIFTLFMPLSVGAVVHFGESIDTVREDLREVSPTVFLGVPRIWEKMHASITLKMKDSSWLKRRLFDFFTRWGQEAARRRWAGQTTLPDRILWKLGDLLVYRPLQERIGMRRCRLPITGAAPISEELLYWYHGIGVAIAEGYGLTETGGVSHCNRPDSIHIGTVGPPVPHTECRLEEDGEILIRGPLIFCGYLHNPQATAECIDDEQWLHTGDIGSMDEDGFLRITGRKKEIIITAGGKNLSPERIENAMKLSPFIKEAVAIGDRRKFISALIQIDYDAVGGWAVRQKIPYTSFSDLASKPEVDTLISDEVRRLNEGLSRVENVRAYRLLSKELHQDDGELTATQKVRRRFVVSAYDDLINSMYGV